MGVTSLSSMRAPSVSVGIADPVQRVRQILDPAGPPITSSRANASQSPDGGHRSGFVQVPGHPPTVEHSALGTSGPGAGPSCPTDQTLSG
jgi:hypothetical protein